MVVRRFLQAQSTMSGDLRGFYIKMYESKALAISKRCKNKLETKEKLQRNEIKLFKDADIIIISHK